jgi:nicotinate-nucleotide adenylyltransferase
MLSAHRPKAAAVYAQWALKGGEARRLCGAEPPAWCFLNVPGVAISSTEIRARGGWRR